MDLTGIGSVADLANTVITKLFPDKSEQERAQMSMALTMIQGQLDANKTEAASSSLFVAGWRPAVGWTCAMGCAWNWLGLPVMKAALAVGGVALAVSPADLSEMLPLLFGLLGMGGLRTVEKINGVASK